MLDKGVIWAIPHARGTTDLTHEWYMRGVGEHKTRHFQDVLDVTVSLVSEKIAENVCAYGEGPSGGLTMAAIMMKEPHIYSAVALKVESMQNPLLDVLYHVTQRRRIEEFGDIATKEGFDRIMGYSPYHQQVPDRDFSYLYVGADFDHEAYVHSIKLISKLREVSTKHGNLMVLREYQSWLSEDQKSAQELAFLVQHSLFKAREQALAEG